MFDEGVDWLYVDIMDGYFVFNLIIGFFVVVDLVKCVGSRDVFFDCYLSVSNFVMFVFVFVVVGVLSVMFYIEVVSGIVVEEFCKII